MSMFGKKETGGERERKRRKVTEAVVPEKERLE